MAISLCYHAQSASNRSFHLTNHLTKEKEMNLSNVLRKLKLEYNAPVTLTFALIAAVVSVLTSIFGQTVSGFLGASGTVSLFNPFFYSGLVTHIFAHANWTHLIGNFGFILILGPLLEEKYGSGKLALLIAATAVVTVLLNALLFSNGLIGASGIVFMFIMLSSFSGMKNGRLPLTFLLVVLLYITKEMVGAFQNDGISHFAHIIGGTCGSGFGHFLTKKN